MVILLTLTCTMRLMLLIRPIEEVIASSPVSTKADVDHAYVVADTTQLQPGLLFMRACMMTLLRR